MTSWKERITGIIIRRLLIILLLSFCEYFFFRNVIGNAILIGDRGDGRLCNLITEHWYNVFRGKEEFGKLCMFYPTSSTIAYSDMLMGYGLIYSIFRLIGCNMFLSYKLVLIFIHIIGTIFMYYFLYKSMQLDIWWSLVGTIAFSFSSTYAYKMGHTQLTMLSFLPVLLFCFIKFLKNIENRKKRNLFAYLSLGLYAFLMYTAWYIAYFTGLFSLIFLIVYMIILYINKVPIFDKIKKFFDKIGKDLLGYILFTIVICVPFAMIYIPILKMNGNREYSAISVFLPEIIDLINVTSENWMLGTVIKKLQLDRRGYSSEVSEGFSIILLLLFGLMIIAIQREWYKFKEDKNWKDRELVIIYRSVIWTICLSILLMIRFSSNGVSLWYFIYKMIPGTGSIRAVARYLLWLSFPMSIIAALLGNRYFYRGKIKKEWYQIIMMVLLFLLFCFNIYDNGVYAKWNSDEEETFLLGVKEPPDDCEVFYIIDSKKENKAEYLYQLDAFEIATYYSINTINGYSGLFPPGWDRIWQVCSDSYEMDVYKWISENQLSNVYIYDIAENIWKKANIYDSTCFYPEEGIFPLETEGLEDWNKGKFAWTSKEFSTIIRNEEIASTGLVIKIGTELSRYQLQQPDIVPKLELYIDGEYIQEIPIIDGYGEYRIPLFDHVGDTYHIELKTNVYFCPKEIGLNEDVRNLSLALYYIGN